ncbi:MAG: anti-phage defense ZorAB system protein ZorA [Desulfomicrobium escambiense]|nr:anti-phage defense ZorAB system protein ZorA [Desulfomicrobium escambiense]
MNSSALILQARASRARWRSTTLAETFFSEQALVDTPLKTSFYKHLPGILTGLGIIGTFSGLIVGLIRFEVSGDADKVRASLNGLIQSVGYSFVVSATAITLAMIFIWVEKSLVTACYRHVEKLCQLIDSLFDTGAGEEYLARLVVAAETSAEHSLTIKDSLVTELRQVFTELATQQMKASALLSKNLSVTIAQGITRSIEEPMGRISMAVQKASANQGEAVNKVLSDVLAGFSSQMQGMFGNQFHEMGDILKGTAEAIQGAALQVEQVR